MQSQRGGRCIVPTHLQPGTRRWVVGTMFWPLYPRERPSTHRTGGQGWVLQPVWKARKILVSPGFNPWMAQPIASHYTYHANPVTISRATLCSNVYTNTIKFLVRNKLHISRLCDLYYCPKVLKYFRES
jgi:hypothetical protein